MRGIFSSLPAALTVLAVSAFIYFVAFPEDAASVVAPIKSILELTYSISPWFYLLLGFALVCWTIVRVWGRPGWRHAGPDTPMSARPPEL